MNNVDRVFAGFLTLIVIGMILMVMWVLLALLFSEPMWTLIIITVVGWLFIRVYPRILRSLGRNNFYE